MSFGSAASHRRVPRRLDASAVCPCDSGLPFGECCGPVLDGDPAPTAERLMRSRYTAFFLGDAQHLLRTWHPATRPDTIDLHDDVRWTGLAIEQVGAGGTEDTSGVVVFTASWEQGRGASATGGALHERSRFVRRGARWSYVDGEVD
ncbi:SEC-C motif-containing protein [Microbacterium sp. cf046]|uniref:YchJ family protein n=1 Tax=Microbacterium sp. cf046 TaxID=1761803 RepID=UPI0008DF8C71|nr:YchJ family metal-binding protein [Microbacterium sp. cf046]SFS03589.1 SEC-C motif-containing protein [Microbacterium sp. cf046]